MKRQRLAELVGFENEDNIFPAVHHFTKFCKLTVTGADVKALESRIAFYVRRFAQLLEPERYFSLTTADFQLLNPNTRNCPIFRSAKDAELTKAIYRRVPVLWQEATDDRPEVNPWRVSFKTLFHMANDSGQFRTVEDLKAAGLQLDGNRWIGEQEVYLPLYEAKMLHQFDHRHGTYKGATEEQLNVGILPQPTAEQKRDASFVVQPRYWIEQSTVEEAIPKFPEPLGTAVKAEDADSIRYVLGVWRAGYLLRIGTRTIAMALLADVDMHGSKATVRKQVDEFGSDLVAAAVALEDMYPLLPAQAEAIEDSWFNPAPIAERLLQAWSPGWFIGWRDITNSTNERTLIASACPRTAVGDKFLLAVSRLPATTRLCLLAQLNSFVCDYVSRQKVGSTAFKYFVMRQIPAPTPDSLTRTPREPFGLAADWLASRALELAFTADDVGAIGIESEAGDRPFTWDIARRVQIRCELDAAFFHLYLPSTADGSWKPARVADGNVVDETADHLGALTRHFPTPRHAVEHIMDTFPLVRKKDEETHGHYRTKARILEIYDGMLEAQRAGRTWASPLDPPPGVRL